jgi:gamma-glutamyl:cysteine ligase YbdK (ATP-grasp superfamily)
MDKPSKGDLTMSLLEDHQKCRESISKLMVIQMIREATVRHWGTKGQPEWAEHQEAAKDKKIREKLNYYQLQAVLIGLHIERAYGCCVDEARARETP